MLLRPVDNGGASYLHEYGLSMKGSKIFFRKIHYLFGFINLKLEIDLKNCIVDDE